MTTQHLPEDPARRRRIHSFISTMLIGFMVAVVYYYVKGMFDQLPYPFNTFLPAPVTRFGDYAGTVNGWYAEQFHGVNYGFSYFPATYLLVHPFAYFGTIVSWYTTLSVFLATFIAAVVFFAWKNMRGVSPNETFQRVVIATAMCYPVLFTIHTGNIEAWVFMLLATFMMLYHEKRYAWSTIPLSLAIAMKVFPAVFLVLLVADKRFKELIYTLVGVVIFTFIPLAIFQGGIFEGLSGYLERLRASQKLYVDLMIISTSGNHYGHSLMNAIRVVMGEEFFTAKDHMHSYPIFTLIVFGFVSLYTVFVEKVLWRRVALMVVCMCLLPFTSTDYKLMHFYLPAWLFFNDMDAPSTQKADIGYGIAFGSLLTLKTMFWYFYGSGLYTTNGPINAIIMVGLIVSIMAHGLRHTSWASIKETAHGYAPAQIIKSLFGKQV